MYQRTQPLAPLSPQAIEPLGEPRTWMVETPGRLDTQISAWQIGFGEITSGSEAHKLGTTVEVWLTTKGRLLTLVKAWRKAGSLNQV